ncbi:XdhC family protein [Portibacter lacus]|uniref:XdhC/CoxI family protein n=1 Tax=Portibacter lacus TaxID=1099794 RepID=A0AA37WEN5_9BACT|nr:XdhC family protein [Portibacter lacus]GLR18028.1 XdhC/CoxI family protein [Portibacter lacus]
MREFISHFDEWDTQSKIVIARVVKTWGSSPRPVGSALIIDEKDKMYGSVSGGCVEGAVLKKAKELLEDNKKFAIEDYGVSDDDAWQVGLSCGGKLTVLIQVLEKGDFRNSLFEKIRNEDSFYWLTNLENGNNWIADTEEASDHIFSQRIKRKPTMLIIGAAHISSDLIHLAKFYDFATVVIDPRSTFAKNINFDEKPDEIIESYPSEVLNNYKLDGECFAIILSHDPKIDDNALQILLRKPVAYIGALGSRRTHAKRVERLKESGFTDEEIGKIHAPIGLDISARTPNEIALSIMAEVIASKNK